MSYTKKQLFYINSYFRSDNSISSSDFNFLLEIDPNHEYDSVTILDASIPKSNYSVSAPHNSFNILEDSGIRLITIPEGNYSRRGFKNVLLPLLNDNSDGYIYSINYDNIISTTDTGKFSFTITGTFINQPTFIFTKGMYNNMGFHENSSYTFTTNTLISPNVMNFRSQDTYYILSDIIQNRNDNILGHIISNQSNNYEHINFKNHSPYEYSKLYSGISSNTYNFKIVNERMQIVDLNGLDVFFTLMIYKKEDINLLIKGYIKYKTMINE